MEQEMFFESQGAKISGTLTLPKADAELPACLFIGGSFPQTRDGDIDNAKTDWFPNPLPGRKLFRDEAEIFTQLGIATFRYDKRGCGKSEGNFNTTGLFDLVADARNALHWLRSLPEIDRHRVGVLGQSEGAVIALMLTAANPELRFCILQGGFYHNFEELLRWQADSFWRLEHAVITTMEQKAPLIYWIYKQVEDLIASAH
jgi:uncharacterized protein